MPLNETLFDTINNDGRHKRNVWSFVGNSALTLLMVGVTEFQIYKLNKYVKENQRDMNKLD